MINPDDVMQIALESTNRVSQIISDPPVPVIPVMSLFGGAIERSIPPFEALKIQQRDAETVAHKLREPLIATE
jgi:hypothetical protein